MKLHYIQDYDQQLKNLTNVQVDNANKISYFINGSRHIFSSLEGNDSGVLISKYFEKHNIILNRFCFKIEEKMYDLLTNYIINTFNVPHNFINSNICFKFTDSTYNTYTSSFEETIFDETNRNEMCLFSFNENIFIGLNDYDELFVYYDPIQSDANLLNLLYSAFYDILNKYCSEEKEAAKVYIVYHNGKTYQTKGFDVKEFDLDIDANYNDDFKEIDKDIINFLSDKNKSGLILLNGEKGTGKTTYIRRIAKQVKRKLIYIPPDMVNYLTDVSFIPFLYDNNNSILVIEDAEKVLLNREYSDSKVNAVSNILNMTDGLLSDALNITFICTFNSNLADIDSALLRKGRLFKHYEFKKLCKAKTRSLLQSLNVSKRKIKDIDELTLADIYNFAADNNINTFEDDVIYTKKIGFK